jgi:predicted unusual protein kinase regulating ubiquinone biosynthesis (AarF/ABC1/UbiB family)
MRRRFHVFACAFIVIARVKLCRWREEAFMTKDDDSTCATVVPNFGECLTEANIWDANYEISARFLLLSIRRVKGLWTKTAQYMSSRADFMPVPYVRELSKLQDEAPATPWNEIKSLLSERVRKELTGIEETPLASASIGQVHVAYLKKTGEKVVVKVQHPHARTLMTDDFWSLKVIARICSWLEPEYEFIEVLMREWATEARKELDFTTEVDHLVLAQAAVDELHTSKDHVVYTSSPAVPFQVEIPRPIESLCTDQVIVMTYCEGVRVDDFDKLKQWNLSRDAVLDGIAQTFAHMMYCTSIFNGDPHAGNLFVRPGTRRSKSEGFTIVLLDWGLAKRLPDDKRYAFCQMVYAAATFDYGLLLDSFKTVGLKLKYDDASRSMEDMRFFLRDMAPREKARARLKSKIKHDVVR